MQIRAFAVTPAGRQFFLRSNRLYSDPDAARAGADFGTAYATAIMPAQRQFDEELRPMQNAASASGRTVLVSRGGAEAAEERVLRMRFGKIHGNP